MSIMVAGGIVYGSDEHRRLDVYRPAEASEASGASEPYPVVLLWHGRGPDEREVLAPLARLAATLGIVCFVPDWRPDAVDGGRTHLRESVSFVLRHGADYGGDVDRIVLAGWSLGGKLALAAALDSSALDGWRPRAVVGIAGGYSSPDPLTGRIAVDDVSGSGALAPAIPVRLIHGTADTVVDAEESRRLHAALAHRGWPTSLDEPATDHAGVIGTEYDPAAQRCRPTRAEHAVGAGSQTARLLADTARAVPAARFQP